MEPDSSSPCSLGSFVSQLNLVYTLTTYLCFSCLDRVKKYIQIRGLLLHTTFYGRKVCSHIPYPQAEGQPSIGCPRLINQICSCPS
jgi:hypothetical protein